MRWLLCNIILLYILAMFARAILSWFPISADSIMASVQRGLAAVTEPVLAPVRRAIPPVRAGAAAIDLSALIVIFALFILRGIVC
jgi:YggT family protein